MLWTDGDLITGTVNISSGGDLSLSGAATKDLQSSTINVNLGGVMNWNDGDINLNILGGVNNNGTINTSCDKSVSGLGTFNNNSGGVFRKTSTGTTTFNVIVTSILGTFKGLGTYDFNNLFLNAGTISPGLSPGIVIVTYADLDPLNYPLLATNSDLDIEIKDGSGAGTGHDQIQKDGNLILKGTLRVTETGSVPDGTYAIVLVTSGTISGNFDNVILPPNYTLTITTSIVLVTKSSTLPVKLVNFVAKRINNNTQLNWQTSFENNSDHFDIERSKPGGSFIKIGEVNAAGTSNQLLDYQFTDNQPGKGFNLYRLRQVDRDNRVEYSSVRWVKLDDEKAQLYVFPTITDGTVFIQSNEKTVVELYNLQGIHLLVKEISNNDHVDLSKYAAGVYVLRNRKDGKTYKITKR
ncbi:MAG TPA: T9SS type A sorting domain-containing protein, partial [Chitinophagaceae bacterium]|nr:T9SS type A sorting domain-containing protein [Chitinophagaceae bacterium]